MISERPRKLQTVKVDHYDGQAIYSNNELIYELGGYLGGGAAGVVYEAFCMRTKQHVAIKILNPVGYKLLPTTLLARCIVAVKGKPVDILEATDPMQTNRMRAALAPLCAENVWWLIHPTSKQAIAAFEDPRTGMVRELTLPLCTEIWGAQLNFDNTDEQLDAYQEVQVKNQSLRIPKIPKKFIKFTRTRQSIHREISNMSGLDLHKNVLRLDEALELMQDTKCTTFLVLELAAGGELFDRIKLDCGTDEATARRYFRQLISGVAFCHASGVCHRDLKPENLLLADSEEPSTLKIADFGLSAIFAITDNDNVNGNSQAIRRLRSVVGSPHYVAPEVLLDAGQGYDGAKADAWSIGVILYAMLAGNLPFGKDLLKCMRYDKFRKWSYKTKYSDDNPADEDVFPSWFFSSQFSLEVKSLIAQLLYPDPSMRLSVEESKHHPWVLGKSLRRANSNTLEDQQSMLTEHSGNASPPAYKNRTNVVVNVPQSTIDQEQWRTTMLPTSRFGVVSPHGFNRLSPHHGLTLCPPSPQKPVRPLHTGGYMPSVDETVPMSSQTPPESPCALLRNTTVPVDNFTTDASLNTDDVSLQFDLDQDDQGEQIGSPLVRCDTVVPDHLDDAVTASMETPTSNGARRLQNRFISPPLATGPRAIGYQFRRNSPPELFLEHFEKAFKLEEIKDRSVNSPNRSHSNSPSMPSTPTQTNSSLESNAVDKGQAEQPLPPSYNDLVTRSTRFMTGLPAKLVLTKIESILAANPTPLPYPYKSVPQRVVIDWDNYQLEVRYGGVLTCTVQVFLVHRGVYLVEFRRGQVEIFQFKRFYEEIREQISESMEKDTCKSGRKRNNSISVHTRY